MQPFGADFFGIKPNQTGRFGSEFFDANGKFHAKGLYTNTFGITDPLLPENNPYKQVNNYKSRIQATGQEAPERKPEGLENVLTTVFDLLSRPLYTVLNPITEGLKGNIHSVGDVFTEMWHGLSGQDKTTTSNLLDAVGWKDDPNHAWYEKENIGRNIVTFLGDILLDPSTYVGAAPLKFGEAASKNVGKKALKESIEAAAKQGLVDEKLLGVTIKGLEEGTEQLTEQGIENVIKDMYKKAGAEVGENLNKRNFEVLSKKLLSKESEYDDIIKAASKARSEIPYITQSGKIVDNRSFMGKLNDKITELLKTDPEKVSHLYTNLENISQGGLKTAKYSKAERLNEKLRILDKLFDTSDPASAARLAQERAKVGRLSLEHLKSAEAIADAFGTKITGIEAYKAGKAWKTATNTKSVASTNAANWIRAGRRELEGVIGRNAVESEIKFANGLSQIYDSVTKDYYLKFKGRPIVNLSRTIGAPATKTLKVLLDPLSPVVDMIGHTFGSKYVSWKLKKLNPEVYAQAKRLAETVTDMLNKETGIPKEALITVCKTYSDILNNDKLLTALPYLVEGGEHIADDIVNSSARAKWLEIKSTLSPQELQVLNAQLAKHQQLMSYIYELDKQFGIADYEPLENYVAHYYEGNPTEINEKLAAMTRSQQQAAKTTLTPKAAKERVYDSIAQAIEVSKRLVDEGTMKAPLKPLDNILVIDALRYMDSWRSGLNRQMAAILNQMANSADGAMAVAHNTDAGRRLFSNFVELPGFKDKSGRPMFLVHPEIAQQLKRLNDIFVDDRGWNAFVGYMDKITNTVKKLQTSFNPNFILRNVIGEPFMNWMAGVKLKSYDLADEILRDATSSNIVRIGNQVIDIKNNKPIANMYKDSVDNTWKIRYFDSAGREIIDNYDMLAGRLYDDFVRDKLKQLGVKTYIIGGNEYTAEELIKAFYDNGLGWSGITKGDLVENVKQTIKREVSNKGAKKYLPWNAMRELGDFTETYTRLAHFIDRIDDGWSLKESALDVKKYHVDYRDLTPTERHFLRRVMPYYTYMRKNIPIQIRMVLSHPGRVGIIGTLIQSSHEALTFPNGDVNMPDYLRESLAIPLYQDDDGNIQYLNWNLPLADLGRLKYDFLELLQTNFVDMLHPIIKNAIETPQNTSFMLGMPIERFEGQTSDIIPGISETGQWSTYFDYTMQQLGVLDQIRKLIGQVKSQGSPNILKPDQIPMLSSILPRKNARQTMDANMYQYRDQLQEYMELLKQKLKLDNIPTTDDLEHIAKLGRSGYGFDRNAFGADFFAQYYATNRR